MLLHQKRMPDMLGFSAWSTFRLITFPQVLRIAKPVYQSTIVNLTGKIYAYFRTRRRIIYSRHEML
jgi:ABC-type arginine/histidine transport system permease subunit